jgi:hypothetical protein
MAGKISYRAAVMRLNSSHTLESVSGRTQYTPRAFYAQLVFRHASTFVRKGVRAGGLESADSNPKRLSGETAREPHRSYTGASGPVVQRNG